MPSRPMIGLKFWWLVLAIFCVLQPLRGVTVDPLEAAHHAFRIYSEREGLPHRNVLALTQDRLGYLWVGTVNGIARFDGKAWQTQELPLGLIPFVNANAAVGLADGSVAFGTRRDGLLIWTKGTWNIVNEASGLGSSNVNAILECQVSGAANDLWVGTWGGGVSRRDGKGWQTFKKVDGLASDQVYCLLEVRKGNGRQIWAGTEKGISIFEEGRWRAFEGAEGLGSGNVRTLALTEAPLKVWIGTQDRGLWVWDGRLHPPQEVGLPETTIRSLWADRDKEGRPTMVVGSLQGLSIWEQGTWHRLWRNQGFPNSPARAVLQVSLPPSRRVFWIGTEGLGLLRYTDTSWRRFPLPTQFQDPRVLAVQPRTLPEGEEVWVGGPEGLGRWFNGAWKGYGVKDGLPHSSVRTLHVVPGDPGLWIGTELGLARWQDGRIHALTEPSLSRLVRAIASDQGTSGPRLWVGLSTGLAVREGQGPWRILGTADGLPDASIRCILPEPGSRRVWVGTDNGLAMWDGTSWQAWTKSQGLPNPWVISLGFHAVGGPPTLWVGLFGSGLVFLRQSGAAWGLVEPLPQPGRRPVPQGIIAAQAVDGQGQVFLAGNRGVIRMKVEADGFPTARWDLQGVEDGLPGPEASPGALQVDGLGRIWLGTTEGLGLWDPLSAGEDLKAKPLHWGVLKAGPEGRALETGAVLGYRQNTLSVTAHLLSSFREGETVYRWHLEGLEPAPGPWVASSYRELVGLRDGSYTLKVWGRDYVGNISGPLSFDFRIQPAPWRHPLAFLGYLIVLGLCLAFAIRRRTSVLDRKNRDLESRITDATSDLVEREKALLHQAQDLELLNQTLQDLNRRKNEIMGIAAHDLRNPLSGILMASEFLQETQDSENPELVRKTAGKIHKAGRDMMELLQRMLDGNAIDLGQVKPELRVFDLAFVTREVVEAYRLRAQAKNQEVVLLLEREVVPTLADPRYVKDVLVNLVSNALKFSPRGTTIHLAIGIDASWVWVTVRDEGPGISEEDRAHLFQRYTRLSARPTGGESSVGLGLSIVKDYVEAMGGRIRMDSQAGEGANFRVEFPRS